jgi:hypothetical protein
VHPPPPKGRPSRLPITPTCPACPSHPRLDILQPDGEDPVRLLATCSACGRWYFRAQGPGHVYMVELPVPTREEMEAAAARAAEVEIAASLAAGA